jgi:hypothetical protein
VIGAEQREARLAAVIGAVVRQALRDGHARRVALLDDGSPEARLAARLLERELDSGAVCRIANLAPELEPLLHPVAPDLPEERAYAELRRFRARLLPDAMVAAPDNKTALLLGGPLPPDPLLPLGDLYASEIETLAGGWSAPSEIRALAERAGGVERLDDALRGWAERRSPAALESLPAAVREEVADALARGRASRLSSRIVPKLGPRTLGVDLFE